MKCTAKKLVLSCLLGVIGLSQVHSKPLDNSSHILAEATERRIVRLVKKEAGNLDNGGIVLTISNSRGPVWSTASGWENKQKEIELTADTPLLAASVTKLFTATAVMQLHENGAIDLSAPLSEYLPGFSIGQADAEDTTIRGMLTHHTALPANILKGYTDPWDGKGSQFRYLDDFLVLIAGEYAPAGSPDFYRYSNVGYELAAALVSEISGMEFYDYCRENIFVPLQMDSSRLNRYSLDREISGYKNGHLVPAPETRSTGEGDLITTTDDLGRFAAAFLAGGVLNGSRILETRTVERMMERQNSAAALDFDLHRGLGWHGMDVPGYPGIKCYFHDGGTNPFSGTLMIIPEYDIALTAIANEDEYALDGLAAGVLQTILEEKTGIRPLDPQRESYGLVSLEEKYYGNYATEMGLMQIRERRLYPELEMMGMKLRIVRLHSGQYGVRLKPLGLFSLPIGGLKSIGVEFRELGGEVVFGIYESGKFRGIGTKFETPRMDAAWEKRLGDYSIINPDPVPFLQSFSLKMDREKNIPMLVAKVAFVPEEFSLPVDLSNPEYGTILGKGRHMGDRIQVFTEDSREYLRYSGHTMIKEKN